MKKRDLGVLAVGTAIGVGAGILLAPKSGKETRKELKEKCKELGEKVKNLNSEAVKKKVNEKIKELEKEIAELDKEKVLKVAKEKAKSIKKKADGLVKIASKKGNELLSKTANDLRDKAIMVTKDVLEKLENSKK